MTTLSQEEKEQVAVLLGAQKCGIHTARFTSFDPRLDCRGSCMEFHKFITLEACMEYAKGKGWGMDFTYWRGDQKYTVELHNADDGDIFAESIGDADDPDPLTAMVRALLKAEEASRGQ